LKVILIVVISLVVLVYGGVFLGHKVIFPIKTSNVPTIEPVSDGTFFFGPQAHATQAKTIEEFIPVLAEQLRLYNAFAPGLWPDNKVVNQSAVVEGIESGKFWYISPDGKTKSLSKNEALSYGFARNAFTGGFSPYEGGMYLAIAEGDLPNYLMWQRYLHLGTYDSILFLTHEGFHLKEQVISKWQTISGEVPNPERNAFLENTSARAKRDLLQRQLMKAVSEPGNTQLILEALSTYADWKEQFPEEYKNSSYFERIEGTAFYYEMITGLYSGYPDQVNSGNLDKALALLATRDDTYYIRHGLIKECYGVSGFACVLLDRLEENWKERLMGDGEATPIEMLFRHFKDDALPAPRQLTQADIDAVAEEIQKPDINRGMPLVFQALYDMLF
jgi:hypothetical protein